MTSQAIRNTTALRASATVAIAAAARFSISQVNPGGTEPGCSSKYPTQAAATIAVSRYIGTRNTAESPSIPRRRFAPGIVSHGTTHSRPGSPARTATASGKPRIAAARHPNAPTSPARRALRPQPAASSPVTR